VGAFGWAELVALLTSIGFGTVSAVIPIVNAEAYVIASQMSAVAGPIPIAIGIAIGQTVGKQLLDLVGQERWGLPIVFVAAVIGFPPLYAVALLAGATTMSPVWFGLTVLVGRLCRFLLVATGFYGLHDWFF
jgi:hypothetical protein